MAQERDTHASQRPSRHVSTQSIQHRIIIESRHGSDIDGPASPSSSTVRGSPVPTTIDGSFLANKRLSIAAMALADELESVSPQSNDVSHHITIERHFNNDSIQGSTLYGGSNLCNDNGMQSRSTIVVNMRDKVPELTKEDPSCLEKQARDEQQQQPQEQQPIVRRLRAIRKFLFSLFVKYWFLLGLGVAIVLAWEFPQVGKTGGIVQSQYSVKYGAVIVIFLLSGLGIDVRVMLRTIMFWRMHLVIQAINFLAMPFVMYGIVLMFIRAGAAIDSSVYKGWIIALSTSTTVSSNVVMTRNAKGNDSGALVNAALGNVIGNFLCPALMSVFQNDPRIFVPGTPRGNPDYIPVLQNLGLTVLVPLVVGQIIRFLFSDFIKKWAANLRFPIINNIALLFLVWSVFCDGVASDAFSQMTGVDIVAIIFVDIFMYLFGCALCLWVARFPWPSRRIPEPVWIEKWRFSREDSVAIMYCGATKTASMGIPLINVLYAQSSYGVVGVLSLPLLMYHVLQ